MSSNAPHTPSSPSDFSQHQLRRKTTRRVNTAERRATHNAVERQRRETLNGRFLDLAALLPNLSQIRRPSKSSIVNSSIAHIHASRRHRLLASRELRAIKLEADALRREINEWRDRAGLPRVEEPQRGDGFNAIIGAELELLSTASDFTADEDPEDVSEEEFHAQAQDDVAYAAPQIVASPTSVSFENPAVPILPTAPHYVDPTVGFQQEKAAYAQTQALFAQQVQLAQMNARRNFLPTNNNTAPYIAAEECDYARRMSAPAWEGMPMASVPIGVQW